MLACLGAHSGSLQSDWSLRFCGTWLLQREQPKRSRVCWVVFSDTGSELRRCHFWLQIQAEGEFNFTFWEGVQGPSAEEHMGWDIWLWPSVATERRPYIQAFPQFTAFGAA